jgi:hypothetical protein
MSGNYRNYGNDPHDKQREILNKGADSLDRQQESLMNTVNLLGETNAMLREGVVAIKDQGDQLGQANEKSDNIKKEIVVANRHAKDISGRDKCTKCLLVILAL